MDPDQQNKIGKTVGYYDKLSDNYDRSYSAYLHHTHDRLLNCMNILPGEKILDISCGTGILAEKLLMRYSDIKLVLNDPSDGMLAIATDRLKAKDAVEFKGSNAEEINFEEGTFDRVICLNSFHYYADQKKVVRNIHDILKARGRVNILDWNRKGWFHLPNTIISLLSPENINTRSLAEMKCMLEKKHFEITLEQRWTFRFWKFYMIEAAKKS
ncbi:hypothetical protein BH23BAC3_BH23BAC3_16060 [soil metagenome]